MRPFTRFPRAPKTPEGEGEGPASQRMPTEFYRSLRVMMLLSRRWFGVSASDVADELGVSKRTASRYLVAAGEAMHLERKVMPGQGKVLYRLSNNADTKRCMKAMRMA